MLSFNLLYHPETLRVSVIPLKTYFLSGEITSVSKSPYDKVPFSKVKLSVPVISVLPVPSALAFTTIYSPSVEIVPKFEKSPVSAEYLVSSTLKASP